MNDNLGMLVLCGCVIILSLVCEVGSQQRSRSRTPKLRQQQTTEAPSSSQIDDMLSVLQDAMSGNEVSFSALDNVGDLLPAAIAAESIGVPFVDNTRVKWSVPQTQTRPSAQQPSAQHQGQTLDHLFTSVVHLGNTNNPQDKANLDQLLRASSVVIPLQNLQIQDTGTHINTKVPSVEKVNISISNDTNIVHPSESRQNPVRRTNTVPFRFPTSNTAIYIPTSLLSRIRRQTPRGFLVLMNPNNQTSANRARLQIANINNGSVLVLARRPSANSQPPATSRISLTRPIQSQGVLNRPIISRGIRLPASSRQHSNSVSSNNRPRNTHRTLNQLPRRNTQISPLTQSLSRNRRQPVQPRQQTQQQQTQHTVPRVGVTRPQQASGRTGQISGIVSRNRPIVRTVSRNGIVPGTQSLRTGQTGQVLRGRSRTPVLAPTTQRRPPVPRAPAVRRRPPTPPDPFSRRFSAGFLRGSNLLVQPPLDNVTFFNADGSRVNIDTDINGNTIRRVAIPPAGGPRTALLPRPVLTLGNSLLRPGPVFGGLGGGLTGGFGGGFGGGLTGGLGGFGGIF